MFARLICKLSKHLPDCKIFLKFFHVLWSGGTRRVGEAMAAKQRSSRKIFKFTMERGRT